MPDGEEYGGLLGAYPFAFRQSASWVFRSYVVASALLGLFVSILLALALVTWVANPTGRIGERALLGIVAIFVLVPLFGPVLLSARRHRYGTARPREDLALSLAGYAFVLGLYLALFISDPATHALPGPLDALAAALDALPAVYGLLPPLLAGALLAAVAWATRSSDPGG